MQKVFISYASDTRSIARELAKSLEKNGVEVWAGWESLKPGDRWAEEINSALDKAGNFLVVVAPNSPVTPLQDAEWQAVLSKAWLNSRKKLIPVIVGPGEPPLFLQRWVPLRIGDPSSSPDVWERSLLDAIRSPAKKPTQAVIEKNRRARKVRMAEIGRAAMEMRSFRPSKNRA